MTKSLTKKDDSTQIESALSQKFSQDQIDLIKKTVAKDATDQELELFLYQANRSGLDPLTKQIYFIKRAGIPTIQTSIDGFRIIAERSGKYAGQSAPKFIKEDGQLRCEISIYKFGPNNERYEAAVGVAFLSEYEGQSNPLWKKMPRTMLEKCAEAKGLRKVFGQDLSGIYVAEEMDQAENIFHTSVEEVQNASRSSLEVKEGSWEEDNSTDEQDTLEKDILEVFGDTSIRPNPSRNMYPATDKQNRMVKGLIKSKNISDARLQLMTKSLGIPDINNLDKNQASRLINDLINTN